MAKTPGKNQVDLEPIGDMIDSIHDRLADILKGGKLTGKQKFEIIFKLPKLKLLRKLCEMECCDWVCPCPDPYPLKDAAAMVRRKTGRPSPARAMSRRAKSARKSAKKK